MPETSTQAGTPAAPGRWSAGGRTLGIGVLIAFTLKGICTTAIILTALFSTIDDSLVEMAPHLLAWTLAAIGGFCLLGGWRICRGQARQTGAAQDKTQAGMDANWL